MGSVPRLRAKTPRRRAVHNPMTALFLGSAMARRQGVPSAANCHSSMHISYILVFSLPEVNRTLLKTEGKKKQNKYITLCYSPWPGDFHATLSFELLPWAELARIVFPSFFASVAWFFADSVSAQHYSNVFVNGRFVVCCVRTRRKVEFSVISFIFFGGCCFCVFGLLLKQCGGRATQG